MPDRQHQRLPMQQGAVETPRDRNARLDFRATVAAIRSDVQTARQLLWRCERALDDAVVAAMPPDVRAAWDERDRALRELIEAGDAMEIAIGDIEFSSAQVRWRAAVAAFRGTTGETDGG